MRLLSRVGMAVAGLACASCAAPRAAVGVRAEPGLLALATGQAASFVIGQPGLEARETGPAYLQNGWGNASIIDGRLFITDTGGARIWVFNEVPAATRVAPDVVLGEEPGADPPTSPFQWPVCIQRHEGRYYVADILQEAVSIWNELPTGKRDYAEATVMTGFGHVEGLTIAGGRMVASSSETNVLVWQRVPVGGTASDGSLVVLSKAGGVPFSLPYRHWTDGTRLLVADSGNHRVLGWNSLPTRDDQEPDFVLGQPSLSCRGTCAPGTSRTTLRDPYTVASNGRQIFVRDNGNNRVMVWNSFPPRNGAPADAVLGQKDFRSGTCNRGQGLDGPVNAGTLCSGYGIFFGDGKLFVADEPGNGSARWLVFTSP